MNNKIFTIILILISSLLLPLSVSAKDDFIVVIDAGHGGHDAGAVDNGVKEKDINLEVALKLESLLKKSNKDIKVVLTRDKDVFLSLQERAEIANKAHGNLFVSIHTNSVDKTNRNRKTVNGTSVYALGLHKDGDNMKVAMRENSVIELEKDYKQKYSGFDPSKDESYIIFEMAQKKNLEQSFKFAQEAQNQLVAHAGRSNRGVKQAGFWVLWATSMPAVLVELDFICNPESAEFMASKSGQEKMAESLFNAVEKYVELSSVKLPAEKKDSEREKKAEGKFRAKAKSTPAPLQASLSTENNQKSSTDDVATPVVTESKVLTVEEEPVKVEKKKITPKGYTPTQRRRRTPEGKEQFLQNEVETGVIALNSESIEKLDEKESEVREETIVVSQDTEKSSKKEKKSKKKDKSETKKNPKNYNNRRILVDANGKTVAMEDLDSQGNVTDNGRHSKARTSHQARNEKIRTVYKIQILASEEKLKQNNPRFHGLKPISAFRVNDLYKYTYGESSDRQEIETLLEEVKKKIPDAFIITSTK